MADIRIQVRQGGTGVGSITAKSIWAANASNVLVELTPAALQSIRINAANTAWEVFTPGSGGTTNVDGGSAADVYLASMTIDGGIA